MKALSNFAFQDYLVLGYLLAMLVGVSAGDGATRGSAMLYLAIDFASVLVALWVVHSGLVKSRFASQLLYRFALLGALMSSFFQFASILPTAAHRALDTQLYALDMQVFGVEPAKAWDVYATPPVIEWYSFFYYSYFFIVALHVFPMMFAERRLRILGEFAWGILFLYCVGQALYLVVPAYGPYRLFAGQYVHEFTTGFWWPLVRTAVNSVGGSSRLDVFPSLHTGAPTFFALFAFRHRAHKPFKYVWPILATFASQIIIATMILRWHYLIDICGGLTLATLAWLSARWVAGREARRPLEGRPPVFEALQWGAARPDDPNKAATLAHEDGRASSKCD